MLMRRLALFLFLACALLSASFGWAASTLEGFDLSSDGDNVQVTLHTDKPVQVERDEQEGNVSLTLSNTHLSPELLRRGLPLVLDNQNRFMGRALPAGSDKVRLVFPNMPAGQIKLNIKQSNSPKNKIELLPQSKIPAHLRPIVQTSTSALRPVSLYEEESTASAPAEGAPAYVAEETASPLLPVTRLAQSFLATGEAASSVKKNKRVSLFKAKTSTKQPYLKKPVAKKALAPLLPLLKVGASTAPVVLLPVKQAPLTSSLAEHSLLKPVKAEEGALQAETLSFPPAETTAFEVASPSLSRDSLLNADWQAEQAVAQLEALLQKAANVNNTDIPLLPWWAWALAALISLLAGLAVWLALQGLLRAPWQQKTSAFKPLLALGDERTQFALQALRGMKPNHYAPMALQPHFKEAREQLSALSVPRPPSLGKQSKPVGLRSQDYLPSAQAERSQAMQKGLARFRYY
jgi:hypothetical protein